MRTRGAVRLTIGWNILQTLPCEVRSGSELPLGLGLWSPCNACTTRAAPQSFHSVTSGRRNRGVGNWLDAGVAYRAATGVPFTPVLDAAFDPNRGLWEPVYGAPLSERLPRYARIDLSASVLQSYWSDNTTVFFVSVMNSLDRPNVREYRYSRDYSERIPLKTPFPRSIYFGVTTTLPF